MTTSRLMKLVTGGMEAFLGIPVLGGLVVISSGYTILWIMLALHVVTLIVCGKENAGRAGSAVGIVTSCIAWIPIVGMIMHIVTAIMLLFSALVQGPQRPDYYR